MFFSIPRYSQYTITLAYHVIAAWFIRSRVAYRKAFVGFVSKVSEVIFCNTWKLSLLKYQLRFYGLILKYLLAKDELSGIETMMLKYMKFSERQVQFTWSLLFGLRLSTLELNMIP